MPGQAMDPSVVIVDDEVTLATVIRMLILQEWPEARVSVFTEVLELDARLQGIPTGSVVLMDRRLGGVDSYRTIRTLRSTRPDVRIAMLSASLGPDDVASARAAGAFAAHEKPGALGGWHELLVRLVGAPSNSGPGITGLGPSLA